MILRVVTLLAVLALVSACTSVPQTSQEGLTRASEYNAELGAQYLNAGDLKRSRQKLQKALEQDADNAKANFFYGLLLSRLKQGGEAIGYFDKAIKLAPEETHYRNAYGIFLCNNGKFEDALEQFVTSAENPFNETPEFAYNNAGSCAINVGKPDVAEEYIREALRKNPRFDSALLNMSEIMLERRNIKVADAYYQRYLKYGTHTADSLWLGIQIKRFLGDHKSIEAFGDRLKRDFPQSRQTLQYLESKQL